MRIILSRTDSIGDVVLTLPLADALKKSIPGCTIIFLGREYTRPVVELCRNVDEFVSWDSPSPRGGGPPPWPSPLGGREMLRGMRADVIIHVFPVKEICLAAKQAGIPKRIATAGRFFTWFTCNRLLHIPRKNSKLHESQLNLKMLKGMGVTLEFSLAEIEGMYGLKGGQGDKGTRGRGDKGTRGRFRLILHPKSKGSAREWGLENFSKLINLLPAEKYNIMITGTREEGEMMTEFLENHRERITDMTGKLSLGELISLISSSDGLVAASTGPLHLAAAVGIRAIGLYAPMRPIFPQRWAPIGKNATYLVLENNCSDCRKTMDCTCIRSITPESILEKLTNPNH
ncbi:MAG: glycosyltransferase family 9 protein [Bacteroidales bacterium]|nr:glycosyltransferase family 9 protein [Bacteroidales bacterium]